MSSLTKSVRNMVQASSTFDTMDGKFSTIFSALDKDGNGTLDKEEAYALVKQWEEEKQKSKSLKKQLALAVVIGATIVGLLSAAVFGSTFVAVEASKDTRVEGRALMTMTEEPVSVGTNEMKLSLATLPFLPSEISSKVGDVSFADDSKVLHRKILAIDIVPEASLRLETTAGDILTWDIGTSNEVNIAMKDGTSLVKDAECMKCTSTNVFPSPDVLEGVKSFEEATGMDEQRRLGPWGMGDC